MSVDASGNVYVAGTSESIDFPGNPARLYPGISPGLFAARLDGGGKPVWTTLFGGGGYDTITAIAQAQGGTLAIGGYSQNQTYVAKLAGDGRSFLFTAKVVGQLNSVAADGSGNVLAAGLFGESNFTNLMKFGAAGEVVSQRALPVVPERVAVDASGGGLRRRERDGHGGFCGTDRHAVPCAERTAGTGTAALHDRYLRVEAGRLRDPARRVVPGHGVGPGGVG